MSKVEAEEGVPGIQASDIDPIVGEAVPQLRK